LNLFYHPEFITYTTMSLVLLFQMLGQFVTLKCKNRNGLPLLNLLHPTATEEYPSLSST